MVKYLAPNPQDLYNALYIADVLIRELHLKKGKRS